MPAQPSSAPAGPRGAAPAPTNATTAQQVNPAAREAFEQGLAAYERGQFEQALAAFERAYGLSPHPKLLFNIGRAADGEAQYARAIGAYQKYLAELPDAENREFVEARIEKLSALQQQATPPTPQSLQAPVTPSAAAETARASESSGPRLVTQTEGADLSAPRRDGEETAQKPLWKRGWVWGVVGGVVAVGVTAAVIAATRDDDGQSTPAVDERYMTLWRQ
jgi:tetratricopeptide (TPR) repeat protein